ncbi:MAG: hypothetical protein P4M11_10640 [Candidatus Pacebacteria bacterium]|nr:hypothetical protein [Candidatus Paceibacterota bacterium]
MLVKDPKKRMPLTEVLEHPWLVGDRNYIQEQRTSGAIKTYPFVTYSLVQPNSALKALRKKSI